MSLINTALNQNPISLLIKSYSFKKNLEFTKSYFYFQS